MIVPQIIYNLSILIAFTVFSDYIHGLLRTKKYTAIVVQGVLFGVAAVIAMMNPFVLDEGLIFDGRSVVLCLCGAFFGPISGGISLVFALVYRSYIGGAGLVMGVMVATSSVMIGIAFRYYLLYKKKLLPSVIELYILGIIVHVAMLCCFVFLPQEILSKTFQQIALTVIIFYPIATVFIGLIIKNQFIHFDLVSELEIEHENLAITLNSIGEGVISIDTVGRIVHINSMAEKMCEISEADAINKPLEDVFRLLQEDESLKIDVINIAMSVESNSRDSKLLFENIYLCAPSQKKYHVVCNVSPIFDRENHLVGRVITFSDLSEQDSLKNSLTHSEAMVKAVFEFSASAIVVMNLQGNFIAVNKAFTDLLGFAQEDLYENDTTFVDITHPDDVDKSKDYFNRMLEDMSKLVKFEKRFVTIDHRVIWGIVTSSAVLDKKGDPIFIVSQIVDITQRKLTEEELSNQNFQLVKLTQELSLAKERAEKNDQLKTAFLANMSHEIRTPLNGILGAADLLAEENTSIEDRKLFAKIMQTSCNRMLNTVNDIIDASKIESNQIQFTETEFTIDQLLFELKSNFSQLFEDNKIVFTINIDSSVDPQLPLVNDYEKLKQVLTKLLSNAHKFTSRGSVSLNCRWKAPYYYFEVKDTGIGISEEYLKSLFANFSQEDVSINRKYEGSGLGLAIARGFARALNGDLTVQSEKNVGSVFCLKIPINSLKTRTPRPVVNENQPVVLNILVAEDDDVSYILAEKILMREFGANVIRAKNGVEALDLFKQYKDINLVLMDLKMPEMDGLECVSLLRKINEDVPIIAVTAFAFAKDQHSAIEVGCNDYISKPYNAVQLIQKIKSFVG
jgi:PAS domain S-box-containing protein